MQMFDLSVINLYGVSLDAAAKILLSANSANW